MLHGVIPHPFRFTSGVDEKNFFRGGSTQPLPPPCPGMNIILFSKDARLGFLWEEGISSKSISKIIKSNQSLKRLLCRWAHKNSSIQKPIYVALKDVKTPFFIILTLKLRFCLKFVGSFQRYAQNRRNDTFNLRHTNPVTLQILPKKYKYEYISKGFFSVIESYNYFLWMQVKKVINLLKFLQKEFWIDLFFEMVAILQDPVCFLVNTNCVLSETLPYFIL